MKPGKYGHAIAEPGDVVYRSGSPQSLGVVTGLKILEYQGFGDDVPVTKANALEELAAGRVWSGMVQYQVRWMRPNRRDREWVSGRSVTPLEQLIETTQQKLDTHVRNRTKALDWAEAEGIGS